MDKGEATASALQLRMSQLLDRRKRESKLRTLKASLPGSVDFSSNDFLSLATSPALRELFLEELKGVSQLGSTGSRLLDGNSSYAEDLERSIADFHRGPAALLVNSGFDANVAIFSFLPQPGDVVVYDELIHASVHDGIKASRTSRAVPFVHNSTVDLEKVLQEVISNMSGGGSSCNVFVAVESVYSMDGDLAPLRKIVELIRYLFPGKNAHLIIDEAHATGVYGDQGRGKVCELGLENQVFLRLHTFGKALGGHGGAIVCTPLTRQYLINYARPLIYTTFMSFPSLAMIKAVYTFMSQGQTEVLAKNLTQLIETLYSSLARLRDEYTSSPSGRTMKIEKLIEIPPRCPESPIISLRTRDPRGLADFCQRAGFVVRAIMAPTVPQGLERVRVCLHGGNTTDQIEGFIIVLRRWMEEQRQMPRLKRHRVNVSIAQTPAARL